MFVDSHARSSMAAIVFMKQNLWCSQSPKLINAFVVSCCTLKAGVKFQMLCYDSVHLQSIKFEFYRLSLYVGSLVRRVAEGN